MVGVAQLLADMLEQGVDGIVISPKDVEALALLLVDGKGAEEINALLETLPRDHMNIVVRELMVAAQVVNGVTTAEDEAGESKAS